MDSIHLHTEIGLKIRSFRKRIKMSTTELAELAGTSQSTISMIENGRSTGIDTLLSITGALGVTLSDILPESAMNTERNNPDRSQLLKSLESFSDEDVRFLLSMLSSDVAPLIKKISPLFEFWKGLDERERLLLSSLLQRFNEKN